MSPRAFIAGCAGPSLDPAEEAFFRDARPWGFILFARNVEQPDQVRALVAALRAAVERSDAPVLIDQEGGRIARLRPPHWPEYPSAAWCGELEAASPGLGIDAARVAGRLIAADLAALGITVNCAPCADLAVPDAHAVIGDRAYAADPVVVAALARAMAEGLLAGGVLPVIKHIPGHGRARADSHVELPRVETPRVALEATDFRPFRLLNDLPVAMTAHVVYPDIDGAAPATTSRTVIEQIIRGSIGFAGLLVTDDLSMQALAGPIRARAEASLTAGCDVLLHCNGKLDEMEAVAGAAPPLEGLAALRAARALGCARPPEPLDTEGARAAFSSMIAAHAPAGDRT